MILKNKYKIQDLIGKGSYSEVFEAKHIIKDTIVAIKFDNGTDISKKLIKHEMNMYLNLKKNKISNIISIKSYGTIHKTHYLIMEYLPYTLNEMIGTCKEEVTKTNYFIQWLQRIQMVHNHDILHRDIKPDNFMVSSKGVVHIIDMGLSCMYGEENKELQNTIGTILFCSFNIHQSKYIYHKQDDIISFYYVIFYILSNGDLPWNNIHIKDKNVKNKVYYHLKKDTDYSLYYSKYNNKTLNIWIQRYIKYIYQDV